MDGRGKGRPVGYPKTGGRQKGTVNKDTSKLLKVLEEYGIDPVKMIAAKKDQLDPKEYCDVALKLMEYIYPKRKAISFEDEEIPEAFGAVAEALRIDISDRIAQLKEQK